MKLRSRIEPWLGLGTLIFRAWPAGVAYSSLSTPLVTVATPFVAIALGRIVDAVNGGSSIDLWVWVALFLLATVGIDVLFYFGDYAARKFEQRAQQAVNHRVMLASVSRPGIEHLEDAEYVDRLNAVTSNPQVFQLLINNVRQTAAYAVSAAVGAWSLATIAPLLAVLPFLSLAAGLLQAKMSTRNWKSEELAARSRRLADDTFALLTEARSSKEVRIFNLGPVLLQRFRDFSADAIRCSASARMYEAIVGCVRAILIGAALTMGLALVVDSAAAGDVTPGELATAIALLRTVLTFSGNLTIAWGNSAMFARVAESYSWLIRQPSAPADESTAVVPDTMQKGIELRSVTFHYPKQDRAALRDVSLHIAPGSVVAIVGENGAGKSTLVKLLCRFYQPTSGSMLIDDADIGHFNVQDWRDRLSGAFQDYASYQFRLREAIGVGDVGVVSDDDRIRAAAYIGGAGAIIDDAPDALETQLGKGYPGGVDVSHGQWQQIALSRGAMKLGRPMVEGQPLLFLLDEPTASLDPENEELVFSRIAAATTAARGLGAITILISHRFSTAQIADQIIVVENGRISEQGSHRQLIDANGHYAEMFRIHAAAYESQNDVPSSAPTTQKTKSPGNTGWNSKKNSPPW